MSNLSDCPLCKQFKDLYKTTLNRIKSIINNIEKQKKFKDLNFVVTLSISILMLSLSLGLTFFWWEKLAFIVSFILIIMTIIDNKYFTNTHSLDKCHRFIHEVENINSEFQIMSTKFDNNEAMALIKELQSIKEKFN